MSMAITVPEEIAICRIDGEDTYIPLSNFSFNLSGNDMEVFFSSYGFDELKDLLDKNTCSGLLRFDIFMDTGENWVLYKDILLTSVEYNTSVMDPMVISAQGIPGSVEYKGGKCPYDKELLKIKSKRKKLDIVVLVLI
jgi:hypothetical protein